MVPTERTVGLWQGLVVSLAQFRLLVVLSPRGGRR
jgi:hypothetical protein